MNFAMFYAPNQPFPKHQVRAWKCWRSGTLRMTAQLKARANCAELAHLPTRVVRTAPVHEHIVATEQGLEGGLEWASRKLFRPSPLSYPFLKIATRDLVCRDKWPATSCLPRPLRRLHSGTSCVGVWSGRAPKLHASSTERNCNSIK